jgi:hypothetical protein
MSKKLIGKDRRQEAIQMFYGIVALAWSYARVEKRGDGEKVKGAKILYELVESPREPHARLTELTKDFREMIDG